jgi:hypothetical protein
MVQPMMVLAQAEKVGRVGGAAVFSMAQVMDVLAPSKQLVACLGQRPLDQGPSSAGSTAERRRTPFSSNPKLTRRGSSSGSGLDRAGSKECLDSTRRSWATVVERARSATSEPIAAGAWRVITGLERLTCLGQHSQPACRAHEGPGPDGRDIALPGHPLLGRMDAGTCQTSVSRTRARSAASRAATALSTAARLGDFGFEPLRLLLVLDRIHRLSVYRT